MMTSTEHPSTKEDILQHLLKRGRATALDLAEVLDISAQAIRRHLKDLEAESLIQYQSVQMGMGRPQHLYALTPKGKEHFPHRYDDFAVSLLDTLAETVGEDRVSSILQKQWQRKAIEYRDRLGNGPLKDRVAALVQLRQAEGYMAELHPVESNGHESNGDLSKGHESNGHESNGDLSKGRQFLIVEHNCAISNVAESFPSVCGHELEMFAMVLQDCTVERTYWMIDGEHRCGYLISSQTQE